jgi:hypothetical protein
MTYNVKLAIYTTVRVNAPDEVRAAEAVTNAMIYKKLSDGDYEIDSDPIYVEES